MRRMLLISGAVAVVLAAAAPASARGLGSGYAEWNFSSPYAYQPYGNWYYGYGAQRRGRAFMRGPGYGWGRYGWGTWDPDPRVRDYLRHDPPWDRN